MKRREGGNEEKKKKLGRVGGQQRRRRGAGRNAGARTTEHVSCHCYPAERGRNARETTQHGQPGGRAPSAQHSTAPVVR